MDKAEKKVKSVKRKTWDVISVILIVLLFGFISLELVQKFRHEPIYWFGYRTDVVLTDSMSEVAPEHADFLAGHDDRIQKNDLVQSKKIDDQTELNLYDIVMVPSSVYGTVVHRIVKVETRYPDGTILYTVRADKDPSENGDGRFGRANIIAKVENIIPKAGWIVSYVKSIYGILAGCGLLIILIGTDLLLIYFDSKKANESKESTK